MTSLAEAHQRVDQWLSARSWQAMPFQQQAWEAYLRGDSGLIHSPTGSGKTLAAWLGPLMEGMVLDGDDARPPDLRVLWITPMRALARDTRGHLERTVEELGVNWSVDLRTGDTSSQTRVRQRKRLPTALVTTPESLSLMLSYRGASRQLRSVRAVVVDEWHELMGSKRGVQLELCLAWLRRLNPGLRVWGLSATLGNLEQAMEVLVGPGRSGRLIESGERKQISIRALVPDNISRFPWAGHLGLHQLDSLQPSLHGDGACLLFTNTRAQAELWYEALVKARPDRLERIALHHGSIDRQVRTRVEEGLASGELDCVVSTSSLDLGVDFTPVDRVIQVGSPRGVARLVQRAGRSGHQPGRPSEVLCVASHAFELVEIAAARRAWQLGQVEQRLPVTGSLDVLIQHMVTLAAGDGLDVQALWQSLAGCHAYHQLSRAQFDWCLVFVTRGGPVLEHYPQFQRLMEVDGALRLDNRAQVQRHRMSVGTITSDHMMQVRFHRGGRIGSVEEAFVARLRPGDVFLFAGRALELVRVRDMTVWVRAASSSRSSVPRWQGGRLPLSSQLADSVRDILDEVADDVFRDEETRALMPLFEIQKRWSRVPRRQELLIERSRSREGDHLFIFPFAGRLANEGLAALVALRLARRKSATFHLSASDYGFELQAADIDQLDEADWRELLAPDNLEGDLNEALNAGELARRQFRDIARISGLVFSGYPGAGKSTRQIQISAGLLYDTLAEHDPDHGLIRQARREVLDQQLDMGRMRAALEAAQRQRIVLVDTERFSPLAFPLWSERQRHRLSTEKWHERVQRMLTTLEGAADDAAGC